ncbi:MAG: single-stranded DNA-binding protein [Erysipelotrichaceae bacterium]|nr:single-stranded DNA-binding protein [Erysipelotrichaceae bacterium]
MINLNNVILIGRLTRDVELRKTQSNTSVCQFTVAVDRFKRKDQEKAEADFINCVAWSHAADFLSSYGLKGAIVSVEGRIQTRSYDGENGKIYVTEVVANNVQIISQRQEEKKAETYETPIEEIKDTSKFGNRNLDINPDDLPFY